MAGCTVGLVGGEGGSNNRVRLGQVKRRPTVRGRGRGVLMAKGFNIKLRIIRRLDLLINQFFLYICTTIYNNNDGGYNKKNMTIKFSM